MSDQLIHVGKLSLLYEGGFIRYVRVGDLEIIRKIFFALRDSNWATAEIVRSDERMLVTTKGFEISYTATNVYEGKEVFRWRVAISGNDSNEINFSINGEALTNFNRNRAGICVLHPIRETKDQVVKITKPDGSIVENKFPSIVSPHQPFFDIQKLRWHLRDKAWAELEFEGDVFETEDQRNWSDTSFKTYSTPLTVPYPVMLKPGDKVSQKVKLTLINSDGLTLSDLSEDIEVTIDESSSKPFPKIGVEFPGDAVKDKAEIGLLKALGFEHLRIELVLSLPGWKDKLTAGLKEAELISASPFIHIVMNSAGEWEEFASIELPSITKLAISPLDRKANLDELLKTVVPKARKLFPGAQIGAGYISYFTELNRNRFDYNLVDFVIYPLNPQAHSNDTYTIIENLPAQEDVVKSALLLSKGKKVHTGLVSIKQRFNPDAKAGTKVDPSLRFDERHITPLAAGWMLASIKYLSEGGADSITLFESHGMAGYLADAQNIFPVYEALLLLHKLKPVKVISSTCNEPLMISSLVIETQDGQIHLILINHTASHKSVSVANKLCVLNSYHIQVVHLKK